MKSLHKFFNYFIAIGFISYGIFFYFHGKGYFRSESNSVQVTSSSSVDTEKIVNHYLQETNRKLLRDQAESQQALNDALRQSIKIKIKQEEQAHLISQLPMEVQIHKDGEVDLSAKRAPALKREYLQETLNKEEYARQFKENARRGGYDIELSEDLDVIKVTPRRPQSSQIDSYEILPSN